MTLKADIQQVFGVEGSSDKFNTHVSATGNSKGLYARETNPVSLDVLCAEFTNIVVGGNAFSSLNSTLQTYINGLSYASVTAQGEFTVEIDTLLGVAFTNDVLLLYGYNNGGNFDFGLYSENNGDFVSNDPQTYFALDPDIFVIAEITTTVGMTYIDQSLLLDIRRYNTGGVLQNVNSFADIIFLGTAPALDNSGGSQTSHKFYHDFDYYNGNFLIASRVPNGDGLNYVNYCEVNKTTGRTIYNQTWQNSSSFDYVCEAYSGRIFGKIGTYIYELDKTTTSWINGFSMTGFTVKQIFSFQNKLFAFVTHASGFGVIEFDSSLVVSNSIFIPLKAAGTTYNVANNDNYIYIGYDPLDGDSGMIRIDNTLSIVNSVTSTEIPLIDSRSGVCSNSYIIGVGKSGSTNTIYNNDLSVGYLYNTGDSSVCDGYTDDGKYFYSERYEINFIDPADTSGRLLRPGYNTTNRYLDMYGFNTEKKRKYSPKTLGYTMMSAYWSNTDKSAVLNNLQVAKTCLLKIKELPVNGSYSIEKQKYPVFIADKTITNTTLTLTSYSEKTTTIAISKVAQADITTLALDPFEDSYYDYILN